MSMDDLEFTSLRKRPGQKCATILETDERWDEFKGSIFKRFPTVTFPDEYLNGSVVSASVDGVVDVAVFADFIGDATLQIQDGRMVIEYDLNGVSNGSKGSKGSKEVVRLGRTPILGLAVWLLVWVLVAWVVISNYDKYMKLW
jgi:hypothetical protein